MYYGYNNLSTGFLLNLMNLQPLDKSSYIPLYMQLFSRLMKMIENGELRPGDKLVSERELSDALNISRITARQSMQALLESGLVYREQGRGTFVAERKMRGLMGFTSFTEDIRSRGYQPSSVVLTQALIHVNDQLQKTIKVGPNDLVLHLVRLRKVADAALHHAGGRGARSSVAAAAAMAGVHQAKLHHFGP